MRREVIWSAWNGPGLEHLRIEADERGGRADGVVIGVVDEAAFRLCYHVGWDEAWRTRSVRVSRLGAAGWELDLTADGAGRWSGPDGAPLPDLDGCVDVDIMATPFTNTLPIRRLRLRPEEAADVRVVYVAVPDLAVAADMQRYRALTDEPVGRFLRFESDGGAFAETLTVDADGFVENYPGLFRRVWSSGKGP